MFANAGMPASDGAFRALEFKVKDSPINIRRMAVTCDNGARKATRPSRK